MFPFDAPIFLWLHATATSPAWLLHAARFVSLELPSLMLAGTAGAWIVGDARARSIVLRILLAMAMAWLLARLGQALFPTPRPFNLGLAEASISHGGSPSFPSKHASVAFAFAMVLAGAGVGRHVAAVALILATAIAWSRVYLGVHFPSDVLAGLLIGTAAAWIAWHLPSTARLEKAQHVHP